MVKITRIYRKFLNEKLVEVSCVEYWTVEGFHKWQNYLAYQNISHDLFYDNFPEDSRATTKKPSPYCVAYYYKELE